jgi:RNA polymerase sigma-70 factor (ECF subfamily)
MLTLEEQDRSLWDRARIEEGAELAERSLRMRQPGPYQVQAAIAALHAEPERPEDTDWQEIALLYNELLRIQPTAVVELNRAAAVAMAYGADRGLSMLDNLERADSSLADYYLLHAARADLLRRALRFDEASKAYRRAMELCPNPVEVRYLRRRMREMGAVGGGDDGL